MTTICRKCGAELPGGTLLTHDLAAHPRTPAPDAKRKVCRRKGCLDLYGPHGHVPGLEGSCAYGSSRSSR